MRKNVLIYLFVLTAVSFSALSVVHADVQTFDRDLQYGMTNDSDVQRLQQFLTDEGYFSGPISGNFYALTKDAVIAFQQANNISPALGFFGPLTRDAVNQKLAGQSSSSTPAPSPQPAPQSQQANPLLQTYRPPQPPPAPEIPTPRLGNINPPDIVESYFYGYIDRPILYCMCGATMGWKWIHVSGGQGFQSLMFPLTLGWSGPPQLPGLRLVGEADKHIELPCNILIPTAWGAPLCVPIETGQLIRNIYPDFSLQY